MQEVVESLFPLALALALASLLATFALLTLRRFNRGLTLAEEPEASGPQRPSPAPLALEHRPPRRRPLLGAQTLLLYSGATAAALARTQGAARAPAPSIAAHRARPARVFL